MVREQSGQRFETLQKCERCPRLQRCWSLPGTEDNKRKGRSLAQRPYHLLWKSAFRVTGMLRPQMLRSPMWCTCVCVHVWIQSASMCVRVVLSSEKVIYVKHTRG